MGTRGHPRRHIHVVAPMERITTALDIGTRAVSSGEPEDHRAAAPLGFRHFLREERVGTTLESSTTAMSRRLMPWKAPCWFKGRRAELRRYEIRSSTSAGPWDIRLLRRAFARVAVEWSDAVERVEVSGPGGRFVVVMDVVGSPRHAKRECERLMAAAWYDAFGVRGSTHIGRLVEEPASRPTRTLAS